MSRKRNPVLVDGSTCRACAHADAHGWWGTGNPGPSHCDRCHRYWKSHREGHCPQCCAHFANVDAFDRHLTGDAVCRNPETLNRKDGRPVFVSRTTSLGQVWALANYRPLPDFDRLGS